MDQAREFRVSDESDIIAVIEIEYRGGGWWRAVPYKGDGVDRSATFRSKIDAERHAAVLMEEWAQEARDTCSCGTDGEDDPPGSGNFACGVLSPHGVSVCVVAPDGYDVTQDYLTNGI